MDELEKKLPNDSWRKVFDEAAETPPPRVWNAIEHRLDKPNDTRILPLWGAGFVASRPLVWGMGMAAAVTLLLIGWWVLHNPQMQSDQSQLAKMQEVNPPSVQSNSPLAGSAGNGSASANSSAAAEAIVSKSIGEASNDDVATSTRPVTTAATRQPLVRENPESLVSGMRGSLTLPAPMAQPLLEAGTTGISSSPLPSASRITVATLTADKAQDAMKIPSIGSNEAVALQRLRGKQLRMRGFGQIHRIVWFQPGNSSSSAQPETPQSKRTPRDTWASASVMPGAFNPMVSVQAVASGNSYALDVLKGSQFTNTTTRQAVNSRSSFSVAYQAGAGIQLTDRWSVESGVGYLVGRSTVETPAQVPAASLAGGNDRNATGNLYVDALRSSSRNQGASANPQSSFNNIAANNGNYLAVQASYSDQTRTVLTNDYQYVQVPVQVGYELRPRKRLSLAVLGGLITNIFVKNTVADEVAITAKDGVYRPIALAATVGARVRYRPPGQWSASMAGVYQPALSTGTQTDSQVQSHPTSTGMSVGVDYHF